jgi:hypothetical protein
VKFKTFGCGAAIAVSSMVSEMAKGKTLDEAMKITNDMVADELGGLPKNKMHCSNLGADALHKAIEDYRKRLKTGEPAKPRKIPETKTLPVKCPYCDQHIEDTPPVCMGCRIIFTTCPNCGKLTAKKDETCTHCGARLEPEENPPGEGEGKGNPGEESTPDDA